MNRKAVLVSLVLVVAAVSMLQCKREKPMEKEPGKIVVYQVMTRLYGNTVTANIPWGTKEQNGVGKFNDIGDRALQEIRDLGVTHVWYTGVLHHCLVGDYTESGISQDDPDVVKGRAGSPYAVRDYYTVNPDLASDVANRLAEFEALIGRTHRQGLKVIIDIVPNHVARNYHSLTNPPGVESFGASDDTTVVYARDNNFYYIPGERFQVPELPADLAPLGGEPHPLADGYFDESPAKWTGNGAREAQPSPWDWYETVKVNFGVKPDGSKDFPLMPENASEMTVEEHFAFWQGKDVPDSWKKFRDIAHYWLAKGVDGFRYDMAQMVPVEFWSYLNSSIKMQNPEAFLLSEIYVPEMYRDYIHIGKMDYLYDKVEFYDTLRNIMTGKGSTDHLPEIIDRLSDIEHHMLHFLENHDEHRIAAPDFAGDAAKGKPAMVVSATVSTSPTMVYFGQEVGEPAAGDAGFGKSGRTTIFDYWGVPAHQRWMNGGAFDGGALSAEERSLRNFYKTLLNFTLESEALMGSYGAMHSYNRAHTDGYGNRQFAFTRWSAEDRLLVVANFAEEPVAFTLEIPPAVVEAMSLSAGTYKMENMLPSGGGNELIVEDGRAAVTIKLSALGSVILQF